VAPSAVLGMSQVRAAFLDDLPPPEEGEAARAGKTTRISYFNGAEACIGGVQTYPGEARIAMGDTVS